MNPFFKLQTRSRGGGEIYPFCGKIFPIDAADATTLEWRSVSAFRLSSCLVLAVQRSPVAHCAKWQSPRLLNFAWRQP